MNPDANSNPERSTANKRILQQAFHEFSRASAALENSYKELQAEAKRLSLELSAANTELQQTLVERERVKNYLRNILHSLGNGVVVLDSSRCIQVRNPAASQLLGIHEDELTGSLDKLQISTQLRSWMEAAFLAEGRAEQFETSFECQGTKRHAMVSATQLASDDGNSGLVFIFSDISRLRELELKT